MKAVVIINPIAGANKQRAELRKMIARLRNTGIQVQTKITALPGDAQRMAAQAAGHANMVIAVGGDGTICEIANGLIGSGIPIIAWPTGTENLFARSIGHRSNAQSALECIKKGPIASMDVGMANQRLFLIIAGVGFDAEVVRRLTLTRKGHITHLSYTNPIWRTFWEYRHPPLIISSYGDTIWQGRGLAFIGNMARYSLGLRVLPDARPDDGLLDLCILPCSHQVQLIGHTIRTIFQKHIQHPGVIYQRLKHVRIESTTDVPVELDGEAAGKLPLEITIRPAAINVKLPPKAASG
ncbi:MAG: diacylglycerol/lipid kinase family protein [Planctomycetota bacterium]